MADAVPTYPARPKCYVARFLHTLFGSGAAATLGPNAVALLAAVVSREDEMFYRGPVCVSPEDLAGRAGLSRKVFLAARTTAVAAGWLVYVPGDRGTRPTYWVSEPADLRSRIGTATGTTTGGSQSQFGTVTGTATGTATDDLRSRFGTATGTTNDTPRGGIIGGGSSNPLGDGTSPGPDRQTSSPPEVGRSGGADDFDPLRADDELCKAFVAAWNAAGLRPLERLTYTLRSRLVVLARNPDWAASWRAAVERCGRCPWLRPGTTRQTGPLDPFEFLKDDDFVRQALSGRFDSRAAPPRQRDQPDAAATAAARGRGFAAKYAGGAP